MEEQPAYVHNHSKHDAKAIMEDMRHASEETVKKITRIASDATAVANLNDDHEEHRKSKLEAMYSDRSRKTDLLEVFFAGAHCGAFRSTSSL